MKKNASLHWSLVLLLIGGVLLVGGTACLFLFSSIPGPDDPPVTAAREAAAGNAAFGAMLLGAASFVIGASAGIGRLLLRRSKSRDNPPENMKEVEP